MLFYNVNEPTPDEIRKWMKLNDLSAQTASELLGISKRQYLRILSGESKAKRIHALAMQMIWLINENKKEINNNNTKYERKSRQKAIKIPIK